MANRIREALHLLKALSLSPGKKPREHKTNFEADMTSEFSGASEFFGTPRLIYGQMVVELPANLSDCQVAGNVRVGAFTYCNHGCEINDADIGRYCSIGQNVLISPGEHSVEMLSTHPFSTDPSGISAGMSKSQTYLQTACTTVTQRRPHKEPVLIGNDVWVGARAIVLRGVSIGHGAVIGAGAVVTKSVEPYAVVAGVPARHLKWRFPAALRASLLNLEWWNYDLSVLGDNRDYSLTEAMTQRLSDLKSRGMLSQLNPELLKLHL